jgi:predicted outer membrane repeat protein
VPVTNPQFDYSKACTLDYAIQKAIDGNTIRMQKGNYQQSIVVSKSLTLIGGYPIGFSTYPNEPLSTPITLATNLMPSTATPIITIEGPVTTTATTAVVLQGLRLFHPSSQDRAISLVGPISPTLSGLRLKIRLDLTQSKVQLNTAASGNGGGINVDSRIIASIGISNTEFNTNKGASGGAIYLSPDSALFGTGATFTSNEATGGSGGAIYASAGSTVKLTSATMNLNKASGNGGTIFATDTALTLDGTLSNSTATSGLGGGLYLTATTSAPATISNLTLTGNKATSGGGIYATNIALSLNAGSINNNQATTGSGGALYLTGGTVTLGASITNNTAAANGGGIYRANGDLTLSGISVMTNTATSGSGGGIAMTGSNVATLTNVRLLNNKAGISGGGAYLGANKATVANSSEIRNNIAQTGSGGGVYIAVTGTVTITNNSLIRDNQATNNGIGGGFYVAAASATITGNTFLTNTASLGGGLYLSGISSGRLDGNTIQYNRATATNGGGIYLNNAKLTVSGLNLTRNTAQVSGGGLYANNSKLDSSSAPITVTLNTATTGSGGGVYLAASAGMTTTAASFTSNTAQVSGGALYADQSTYAATSTTAVSNTATTANGGALYFNNTQATLGATILLGNKANLDGGALYAATASTLTGTTLTAERNSATIGNGGAFLLKDNSKVTWSGANTLRYNKAKNNGGAIYASGGGMQVNGGATVISNTVTTGSGGGVYLTASAGFTVTGALSMQENIAQVDGGGIFVDTGTLSLPGGGTVSQNVATTGSGGGINFANSTTASFGAFAFQSNRAQVNGGALRAQASTLTFTGATSAISNTATTGSGGGFHLTVGLSTTFSQKLTLKGNTASISGGGIYATDTNLSFGDQSEITDNVAQSGSGGGVYLDNGTLTTAKISFLRNKAKVDGGGLYALNGALTLANASVVQLNEAQTGNGGGIYAGGGAATLIGVSITQNTAQLNGGGLYLTGNPATTALSLQSNSTVSQNKSSTAQGGGLFVTSGSVTINASSVSNNQAQTGGGGLYQTGGTLTLTNTATIAANKTITGAGGGLAMITGTVGIFHSQVNQNSAYGDGGGLYAPGSQVQVADSSFSGNTILFSVTNLEITTNALAIARGGAVYVDGTNVIIDRSIFDSNSAQMGGGGIYARTLFAHIANSTLNNNNGGRGGGGALYLSADLVEVLQNNLDGNNTAGNGGALAVEDTDASKIISNTLTNNFVRQDIVITTTVLTEDIVIQQTGQIIKHAGESVTGQDSTEGTGGGVHFLRSTGNFVGNSVIRNENQSGDGGGFYLSSSTVTMTNNVVAQNSIALSSSYASGIYVIDTQLALVHNTIANNANSSTAEGTLNVGVYITKSQDDSSAVQMTNNIISGHQTGVMLLTGNTASLLNNLFFNTDEDWGGPVEYAPASGNKIGDPLFVDPDHDNYDIQRKSAAFDMGIVTPVITDIRGTKRLRAFGVDAGAYEQRYLQGVHMRVSASPLFVGNGEQITYHIQVVNHSPVALSSVSVNIGLPSQQSVSSVSGPGCSGTTCAIGTMSPEQLADITLVTKASGVPPANGFIEMNTTVNVTVGSTGPSDSSESITTRLQQCRIRYGNTDYVSFAAAIAAVNTADDLPDTIKVSGYCGGSFEINKKLTLQGGWNFPMTILNPTTFPTTIDGGGSGRVIKITGENAPTVENITLRNGNAAGLGGGPSGKDAGGIVYIQDARATLSNVRMVGGRAAYGAGLYVAKLSAPIIINSTIESGQAGERGGGVYAHNSSPELTNVTIKNNVANAGGGVYLYKSEAKIVNCTISNNRANGSGSYLQVAGFNIRFSVGGGGGVNFDESKASISGSTLEGNTAKAGGAIFADNSPGSVTGSTINNNEANGSPTIVPILVLSNKPGGGGAIYAQRSDMVIENNRITHNRATAGPGGAIHIFNGSADGKINGNFLGYNSASKGAAVYVFLKPDTFKIFVLPLTIPDFLMPILLGQPQPDPPKLTMINNTIAHNSGGSIVHFYGESYGELVGNLFAFNSGTGVVAETQVLPYLALIPVPIIFVIPIPFPVFYVPKADMNYTLWYQNSGNTSSSGVGASVTTQNDLTGDPAFKNDGYHIKRISAAYNTGKNTGIPVDIDGMNRPQADITDMGADEYPALGVRYVAPGGGDTGGEKCKNFLNPCGSLQTAIDNASEGDLIKMAGGTYTGVTTRAGQVQMGYINKTLTIQGGYYRYTTDNSVTEGNYTANDWEVPFPDTNPTILDGGSAGRVLYIVDEKRVDEDGNPIKVEPIISGISIKNGNSNGLKGPQGNQFDAGGAIYLDNTKITISNVDISNSTADYGGAVYMISSTLTLSDVVVKNNTANERGGGFYLETSNDVIISNIVIESNKAPRGGGLYLDRSAANIVLNQIRSNGDSATTLEGGGIYLDNSPANVISNTITANNAANGAGFYATLSDASFQGNTITNNKALNNSVGNGRGGGCYVGPGSTNVINNLIQGNQAILGAGCFLNESAAPFANNQVLQNIATTSGGGFYVRNSSSASLQQNTVDSNRANGTTTDDGGGGIFLESSNSTLRANTVTNNSANAGGGLYLSSFSNANVQENTFNKNTATLDGGGVYLKLSDAQLSKNTITFNKTAQGNGGGVYIRLSSAQLSENTIEENVAILAGGGVYLDQSGASLNLDSVRSNTAKDGAGVYIFRSDTAKFTQVGIELNRASEFGGGVYIRLSSVPLEDHAIVNNYAQVAGGGVYIDESAVSFNRNTIRNNEAGQQGGGIAITRRSFATLGSNAVVDNRAGNTGSGIYVAGSQPKLIHTTIARNVGGDGTGVAAVTAEGSPSTVTLVNTILANQSLAVRASTGNTVTLQATLWNGNAQNWQLGAGSVVTGSVDLNFFGEVNFQADGIHIQKNSKAIGVGVTSEVGRDIDGDGRPQGNGPELGADELLADCSAVVDKNLTVVYTKVQDAINAANPGDEVRISGTCVGAQTNAGTSQLAYINKEITVRGGYTPTNWLLSYPITQPTFLDAQGQGRVIFVATGKNPTIEHLNLAGGDARNQGGGPSGLDAGGILYARNANPVLRDLTMSGGGAYYGGALYLEGSTSTLTNSQLNANQATKGGAIFLRNAQVTLSNNSLDSNIAADGAGIFLSFSQSTLDGNVLTLNTATAAGGGIFLESSNATLRNNGIFTNTAQTAGGIYVDGAAPAILRNAIGGNTGQNGGGIYLATSTATVNGNQVIANNGGIGAGIYVQAGNPTLDNNVIAKNVGQIQAAGIYILSSSPKLRHNTLAANVGGDGSGLFITDLGVQPANIEAVNNIFVDHTLAITLTAGNKITLRNDLWNNNAQDWGGNGIVDDKGGHVRADPLFVNADGNDYHLQAASPARDQGAGDAGVSLDYDNQTRPADNGFDIGADEFVFTGIQVFIQTVPDPVVAGADFQLIVRVVNIGNIDQSAKITVTLPNVMTPSGILTFDAQIRRSETWVQTINARVNSAFSGALKIKADVTTSANTSKSVEASISVSKPDYAIALIADASPSPVPAGAELVYQIRVNNVGNQSLTASVEATLPDTVVAAASLNFTPGELGPGGAWTKSVRTTVDANAKGNLVAIFHATTQEGPAATYTLTVPIAEPSLVTGVSATPDPILAGGNVTYTLRVTNTGNIDFTTIITFVAPVDENGRPLIAPGADQVFSNVAIPAGATWTQTIVGVTQPGYTGPLHSQVRVDTQTGMVIVHDDTRQVILPTRGPTIVAVRTGAWNDPNTWEPARVPNESDIALVKEKVVVTVDGSTTNPIVMTGLINQGTILLNCVVGVDMQLNITDFIDNTGLIRGRDGQAVGEPGCGISVTTNELTNSATGVIRAGDGMDGAVIPPNNDIINGGDGGAMSVFVQSLVNDGEIRAGDGGDLLAPATSGKGGDGGDILVAAGPPVPALVLNSGLIAAGNGGAGPGRPQGDGRGGDGGSAAVISASQFINDHGEIRGGQGGDGGDDDGGDGGVSISAAFIWDNGAMASNGRDFAFHTIAKPLVRGVTGATVLLPVTFLNEGVRSDSYILIWSNSQGWEQSFLPETTQRISGLRYNILLAPFIIPPGLSPGEESEVQLSARSQGSPTLVQAESIRVLVVGGGRLWLPSLFQSNATSAATGQDAPTQPSGQVSYLPLIGD